jgi:hypothetical protein
MNVPDAAKILAYVAFVWLALRSLSACTFVFLGLNLEVCRVAAIQVQGRRTGCSSPGRPGSERAHPTPRRTGNSSHELHHEVKLMHLQLTPLHDRRLKDLGEQNDIHRLHHLTPSLHHP